METRILIIAGVVIGTMFMIPTDAKPGGLVPLIEAGRTPAIAQTFRPRVEACDPIRITNEKGELLYLNDRVGCTDVQEDGTNGGTPSIPRPTPTPDPRPVEPVDPGPKDPPSEGCRGCNSGGSKGNASANNGKGGNYDKTGHEDNGKGNGRGRD